MAAHNLPAAFENGTNEAAREAMSLASLLGGLALANAKLGAVHGFAGPLGGLVPAPHGAICARLLPFVVETNVYALQSREPNHPVLKKFDSLAQIITGDPNATAQDGIDWMTQLCERLFIPPLSTHGLSEEDFPLVIKKSKHSSSMKGNPIRLNDDELKSILKKAI
jgi:alcohol dehydrogenase class IV